MPNELIEFLDSVSKNIDIEYGKKAEDQNYPIALGEVYDFYNGISCPFLDIFQVEHIDKESVPGWIRFGFDGYFSFLLYQENGNELCFDLWDHESGNEPECSYSSITDIVKELYEKHLESESDKTFVIRSFSENVRKIVLIQSFGLYIPGGYSEVKKQISNLPMKIQVETVAEEIELSRLLETIDADYEVD